MERQGFIVRKEKTDRLMTGKEGAVAPDLFDTNNVVIIKDEGYNVYGRRNVLDLLAEELAAQAEKEAQEKAFQAELDRLNSISIDESLHLIILIVRMSLKINAESYTLEQMASGLN